MKRRMRQGIVSGALIIVLFAGCSTISRSPIRSAVMEPPKKQS